MLSLCQMHMRMGHCLCTQPLRRRRSAFTSAAASAGTAAIMQKAAGTPGALQSAIGMRNCSVIRLERSDKGHGPPQQARTRVAVRVPLLHRLQCREQRHHPPSRILIELNALVIVLKVALVLGRVDGLA
jgi:hypothetical protein